MRKMDWNEINWDMVVSDRDYATLKLDSRKRDNGTDSRDIYGARHDCCGRWSRKENQGWTSDFSQGKNRKLAQKEKVTKVREIC